MAMDLRGSQIIEDFFTCGATCSFSRNTVYIISFTMLVAIDYFKVLPTKEGYAVCAVG
jgi:hypothetical protein